MPTIATRKKFTWDGRRLRYRHNASGRFVSAKAVKSDVLRVERESAAAMRRATDDMIAGRVTLGEWQERFADELKSLHTSGAMAGVGGMAQMTPADYGRLGAELRFQYSRLERFAEQLAAGEVSERQARARVELYVASIHKTYENRRRDRAFSAFRTEFNVLANIPHDRHCATCLAQTRFGRVPIGTLVPPGERDCMANCKCRLGFADPLPRVE